MTNARLDVIGIVVSDIERSAAFYRRLGIPFDAAAGAEDHAEAELGGGMRLMLDNEELIKTIVPDWSAAGAGRITLAVSLPTPADVDQVYAELAADGFGKTPPWDAFWQQRYATLVDPDGNQVDLYAPLSSD